MKPILKRIFPFVIGGAVVVFAACQDTSQNPTEPDAVLQQGRGRPGPPQRQFNQIINTLWPGGDPNRSLAHEFKSDMFDAVADGNPVAAETAAVQLANLAYNALQGDQKDLVLELDVQTLLDLLEGFVAGFTPVGATAMLDLLNRLTMGENTGVGIVTQGGGGTVTTDPDLGSNQGFGGVAFEPGDLFPADTPTPPTVVVIVERQDPPCLPANLVGQQGFGCFSFRTEPPLAEFDEFVTVGVCLDLALPPGLLARLRMFEAQGPGGPSVTLLDEAATPDFLVTDCTGFLPSTESSWLDNFANAGWDKVGRPLASLLAPEPVYATTFLATSGSLGGRTKNFSNIGWADPLVIDDGFEVPSGWGMTGFWHRSMLGGLSPIVNTAVTGNLVNLAPGDGSGGAMPVPLPADGGDWVFWYGDEGEGNYIGTRAAINPDGSGGTSTASNSGTLTSPVIMVPEDEGQGDDVILRFDAWFDIESVNPSIFDIMEVFIDEVSGPSVSLGRLNPGIDPPGDIGPPVENAAKPFTSGGFNAPPVWIEIVENLNAFRGKSVRLRFEFNTIDILYNGYRGWLIDNVQVGTVDPAAPAPMPLRAGSLRTGGLSPAQPPRPRD